MLSPLALHRSSELARALVCRLCGPLSLSSLSGLRPCATTSLSPSDDATREVAPRSPFPRTLQWPACPSGACRLTALVLVLVSAHTTHTHTAKGRLGPRTSHAAPWHWLTWHAPHAPDYPNTPARPRHAPHAPYRTAAPPHRHSSLDYDHTRCRGASTVAQVSLRRPRAAA